MTYKDEIIIKLQNEGFNYLPIEELERLAHFIDMETIPLKAELFALMQNNDNEGGFPVCTVKIDYETW